MLELLSELLFIVYQYYYYYFSFFSSLNKRFPSIIKQAGLIFLYNCNYNNCYCNCECLVYIYSLVAFNVYTLKNDKKKLQIKKKKCFGDFSWGICYGRYFSRGLLLRCIPLKAFLQDA